MRGRSLSTPFLKGFATRVLVKLVADGHVEVEPGSEERVVSFVADNLHGLSKGSQLITSLVKAIIACPDVVELYIDDDDLRELITDLQYG